MRSRVLTIVLRFALHDGFNHRLMIAIVGNGPLTEADIGSIRTFRHVVRFNLTPNIHSATEAQTTELFLSVSSKQIGHYLSKGDYAVDPAFKSAKKIIAPYSPEIIRSCMKRPNFLSQLKGRQSDWTPMCREIAKRAGKDFEEISTEDYYKSCALLGIRGTWWDFIPSSGFLAVQRVLAKKVDRESIHVFGFGFKGWKHHHWKGEERQLQQAAKAGLLVIHPVKQKV